MVLVLYIVFAFAIATLYGFYSPWIFQSPGEIKGYQQKIFGRIKVSIPFDLNQHNLAWWWWQFFINFFQTVVGAYLFWKALEMSFTNSFSSNFYMLLFLGFFGWIGRLEKLFFIFYSSFPKILEQITSLLIELTKKIK